MSSKTISITKPISPSDLQGWVKLESGRGTHNKRHFTVYGNNYTLCSKPLAYYSKQAGLLQNIHQKRKCSHCIKKLSNKYIQVKTTCSHPNCSETGVTYIKPNENTTTQNHFCIKHNPKIIGGKL